MTTHPVHVITGFLGSGKTTLVNQLLRDPAFAGTAVLVNEFGEIAIDHDLIETVEDGVVLTTSGCLCCSASSDVLSALATLWGRVETGEVRRFTRVIVETSGLVDPAPVVNSLTTGLAQTQGMPVLPFHLAGVVTLYDIVNGGMSLDHHLEAVKQVALADAVVLTKTDLADDPATRRDIARDRERLHRINPGAQLLDRHADWPVVRQLLLSDGSYDLSGRSEDALGWLQAEAVLGHAHDEDRDQSSVDRNRHDDRVQAHCIVLDEPLDPRGFYFFLEALRMSAGPKILRLKGLFALADDPGRPVVVHGVQHVIHPVAKLDRWPSDDRRTRLVLIGRDLKIESIRRMMSTLKPKKLGALSSDAATTAAASADQGPSNSGT